MVKELAYLHFQQAIHFLKTVNNITLNMQTKEIKKESTLRNIQNIKKENISWLHEFKNWRNPPVFKNNLEIRKFFVFDLDIEE